MHFTLVLTSSLSFADSRRCYNGTFLLLFALPVELWRAFQFLSKTIWFFLIGTLFEKLDCILILNWSCVGKLSWEISFWFLDIFWSFGSQCCVAFPLPKLMSEQCTKGQLISEWLFCVFNFPKNQCKNLMNFCPRI